MTAPSDPEPAPLGCKCAELAATDSRSERWQRRFGFDPLCPVEHAGGRQEAVRLLEWALGYIEYEDAVPTGLARDPREGENDRIMWERAREVLARHGRSSDPEPAPEPCGYLLAHVNAPERGPGPSPCVLPKGHTEWHSYRGAVPALQATGEPPHVHDWTASSQPGPWPGMPGSVCIAPNCPGAGATGEGERHE